MREENQKFLNSKNPSRVRVAVCLGIVALQWAALSGCGSANASNTEALAASSPEQAAATVAPGASNPKPVRVSRSFFDARVEGSIRVQGESAGSAVSWREQATSADHPGCATFEQAGGLELCFTLMNDVDSFGLNGREMGVSGLESYLTRQLGQPCPGTDWNVKLVSSARLPETGPSRSVESFTVSYAAEPVQGSGCSAQPVLVDLTLQKI